MMRRRAVNSTSGITAKGSRSDSTTWLPISSLAVALAIKNGDGGRRNDGDAAGEEAPHPRFQPELEEALHHDLAGERRGDRRVEPAGEQRQGEQRRSQRSAEQRCQERIGLEPAIAVLPLA